MKVTLTFVNAEQRVSPKTGKPYTSVSIKTVEYGDRYLSGFGNRDNMNWRPGMEVYITVEEKPNKDPMKPPYLNFETLPASTGELIARIERIEGVLGIMAQPQPVAPATPRPQPAQPAYQAPAQPQYQPSQGMPTHPGFLAGAQQPPMAGSTHQDIESDLPF